MIHSLSDAIISSDYFGPNVPLNNLLSRRINIVFGTNGSGKSTIAGAFRSFALGDDTVLQLPRADIDDEGRKHIFVFDEQFVRENLEMSENTKGLGTIVTIGEAVDREKEEKELEGKIANAEDEMESARLRREEEDETANTLQRKLDADLKKDGSYADLGKGIKCQKNKIPVDLNAIINVQNNPSLSNYNKAQLRNVILSGIDSLSSTKEQSKISWFPSMLPVANLPGACKKAKDLLAMAIEKPELSDREQKILQLGYLKTKEEIVDKGADTCPLCHQPISQEHRSDLGEMIRHIEEALKDVASEFKTELEACKSKCSLGDYPVPDEVRILFNSEADILDRSYKKLKDATDALVEKLEYRIHHVEADSTEYDTSLLESCYSDYEEKVNLLSRKITSYNNAIDNRSALQKDLLEKNVILAYLEHESDIKAYQGAVKRSGEETDKYNNAQKERDQYSRDLETIHAKRSNTNEAREFINKCLQFIFMQPGRLELVSGDGADNGIYILKSNGRQVALDKVSVGERNAIALAYFFASTFQGKRVEDRYSDEALYVIDDPVSSFDQGNRVGILTFISDVFNNVIRGNRRSTILTLTHDLQTAYNLVTIVQRISKEQAWEKGVDYDDGIRELKNKRLAPITKKSETNYHRLLREMYEFAAADGPEIDNFTGMGNKIRQLLESYTNFNYNRSLDAVLNNDDLLKSVPNEFHNYYRRLAARIVFNTASHSGITVDALGDGRDSFTQEELHSVAQNILAFIYFTNPLHLDFILKGSAHKKSIEEWKKQIPTEDESSMLARINEIEQLKKLANTVVTVEQDDRGNCHYGKCLIANAARSWVGHKVRLTEITYNYDIWTKQDYPAFARFAPDDSN